MPDTKISDATSKSTLAATDMLPLAAAGDDEAYHVTGANLFGSLPAAATGSKGVVELATAAEAQAGTDTERAVTPAGLLLRKVGTAYLAGDLSGDPRGAAALDLQADRSGVAQVASGDQGVCVGVKDKASAASAVAVGVLNDATGAAASAVGYNNDATQPNAAAFGKDNVASADSAAALGVGSTASAAGAVAVGKGCTASGAASVALGNGAVARITKTVNLGGAPIARKDNGEAAGTEFETFAAAECFLLTKEIDAKATGVHTITIPSGAHFFVTQVGVICTAASGISGQPTIRCGWTGDGDGLVAEQALLSGLTARYMRQIFNMDTETSAVDGHQDLAAEIVSAATGTTYKVRFYFLGLLLEDE